MHSPSRPFRRRGAGAAALVATAMVLASCGGGGGSKDTSKTTDTKSSASTVAPKDDRSNEGDKRSGTSQPAREAELTFLLPEQAALPAGHRMLDDRCAGTDEWGGWVTFAVPEAWEAVGFGRSGGTSPTEGSLDHDFKTDGGKVYIEVDADSRDDAGKILNGSREATESFDYEITVGSTTTKVVFTKVSSIEVGDQTVDLFKAALADYPDVATISGDVYKARLDLAEITGGDLVPSREFSSVLSVEFDPAKVTLTDDEVATIVASAALPECSRTSILVHYEVMLSADLDGDGQISTTDDLRAVFS